MDPAGAVHGPVERPTGFDVDRAHARRLAEHERWAVRVDVVLHQVGMDGLEAVVDESGRVAFVDASAYRQNRLLPRRQQPELAVLGRNQRLIALDFLCVAKPEVSGHVSFNLARSWLATLAILRWSRTCRR